jgi:hypothetical protein
MSSGISSLTILSEEQKFNGENLLKWTTTMTQLLASKGLLGYTNGKIAIPTTTQTPSEGGTTTATPIYSTTPTLDEWNFRDQLTRGHITLNCTDTASLGVETNGTAKDAWDSIQAEWGRSTDMRRSHAQEALDRTSFVEGSDIQEHVKLLRTRKAAVENLSTSAMTDETWRGIIIRSIPPTTKWLPVIPSLYSMTSSADIISTLLAHGMILDRGNQNKPASRSSNTVLVARTGDPSCTNPGCKAKKRSTHTTENCYWPGGGKEGQFPPNFGQRTRANAAGAAASPHGDHDHFVLSARIRDTPGTSGVILQEEETCGNGDITCISKSFRSFKDGKIPTFMDSGASDTMYVSKDKFTEYTATTPRIGDSAKAMDGGFEIVGEGKVVRQYMVEGKPKDVTYTRVLHTPTLNANLISVSSFDKAGLFVTFGGGRGVVRKANGNTVLTARLEKGMYVIDDLDGDTHTAKPLALLSLSQPTSLEQWHRRLAHCSPLTIQEMAGKNLVDGLKVSESALRGKCEDCILGRQTRRPFDGVTEKSLDPLELVSFDLWGPSRVQSAGGKSYFMPIVDGGTSYKYGAYLADKSDLSTIAAFDTFRTRGESMTGRKIRRLRTDRAYDSAAWGAYCQEHGIIHEFTAPYSSAQNGLAERAIRTTLDDVRTLLRDSGLGHSYWCEAAAYSIDTRNLIPSRRHPGKIPLESFSGKRQSVLHLRVFGAKCWAKIPTVHGVQVTGGSKLDPRGVECRLLGYTDGNGNYKVQDVATRRVFVSRDVVFEEGQPHRTSSSVGENETENIPLPLFEMNLDDPTLDDKKDPDGPVDQPSSIPVSQNDAAGPGDNANHRDVTDNTEAQQVPAGLRRSSRIPKPSSASLQSKEYQQREMTSLGEEQDWTPTRASAATDDTTAECPKDIACHAETKKSAHKIPHSYRHAMATDPDRWMIPMQIEMETLKSKHTWDLVKPPPGANVMDSRWVYDIKWDGEGNRIKDKARLVGKGYTQQIGIDYNETWAGVTRLESVRMTAAIAARQDLKLWRIDFVGAYLNSLTKEDIYMKQPEGFVDPGFEDHVCKLVHTIYGTMQGAHDWYETLSQTYNKLGYTTSRADPCVRIKQEGGGYTITDTYTDDVFGASKSDAEIEERKREMGEVWEIKDVSEIEYFLGTRVQQDLDRGTVRITQRPYWENVISRFDLEHVTLRNTPLPTGIILDNNMSPKTDSEKAQMADKPYRPILGCVMWGHLATRPDLSFAVSLLSRFQANPGIDHWNALMHVVGYVRNTIDYGLTYSRDGDLSPLGYADADYGGCRDTRRSTSGYVFMMAGGPVTWSSKRQSTVALSTVEAEYVAMSRCAQQMTWMQSWLDEVAIEYATPGVIKGDSRGAISLTKNTKDHGKIKHIDIRHHYIRDLVHSGRISIEQIPSADNLADLFTKALPRDHHHRLLGKLNVY